MHRCLQRLLLILVPYLLPPLHAEPARKLVVVSVDGLDWRYLRDRDQLHLKIPNMRRLLQQGRRADGVIGVWPTITWPSHTSLITGVRPDQHGIEGNRRPKSEGGDYYWNVDLLKSRTLWQVAHDRGLKTAAITWPVTVGAAIDFNLPEKFFRRQGGSMDLDGVTSSATTGLADLISKAFPSFPQQWVDDRTRALAARFLLREKQPDLLLLHLVGLDAEEHEKGPFDRNANAVLEYTDELIGELLAGLPSNYMFALVSDHGFERIDRIVNPRVLLSKSGVTASLTLSGGILTTTEPKAATLLRQAAKDPSNGIGDEISRSELLRYAPKLADAAVAFQPADHVMFGSADRGDYATKPEEKGSHGFWPMRHEYRSVFLLWGPGIRNESLGEMQMVSIADELAATLGLKIHLSDRH
jgi:predicted AlkP superfamily pyrophosphatase or phosphodiesterase